MKIEKKKNDYCGWNIFGFQFVLHKRRYAITLLFIINIFVISLLFINICFGYKITNADIPGGTLASVLLSYLIHTILE